MLEHYLIPIAPHAVVVAILLTCLFIFLSQTVEIRRLKLGLKRVPRSPEQPEAPDLGLKLEQIMARLRDAEDRTTMVLAPGTFKTSLNLSKRNQVIRLSRRGEQAHTIAAMLSMPKKEVELLLKVHGLLLNNSSEA